MAATKLRSSSMSLHGVSHKSRVFDPTCLYEAKAKPVIQQKRFFDSYMVNYADDENLSPDTNENEPFNHKKTGPSRLI